MIGWVGDQTEELSLALFTDADYAGCGQSLKSTSGAHMHIQGKKASIHVFLQAGVNGKDV